MGDMTNGSNINRSLPRNDLWVEWRDLVDVELFKRLRCEMCLGQYCLLLLFDDVFTGLADEFEFSFTSCFCGGCFDHFVINADLFVFIITRSFFNSNHLE